MRRTCAAAPDYRPGFWRRAQGTLGHPADEDVILRFMNPDGSGQRDIVAFVGGQGTINVDSWAPDSRRFAYVAYPIG